MSLVVADSNRGFHYDHNYTGRGLRPGYRQFLERLHHPYPWAKVDCAAGIRLSEVRDSDSPLRQRASPQLLASWRKMPPVQEPHLAHVPAGGDAHGPALPRLLCGIRVDPASPEVGGFFGLDDRPRSH